MFGGNNAPLMSFLFAKKIFYPSQNESYRSMKDTRKLVIHPNYKERKHDQLIFRLSLLVGFNGIDISSRLSVTRYAHTWPMLSFMDCSNLSESMRKMQ